MVKLFLHFILFLVFNSFSFSQSDSLNTKLMGHINLSGIGVSLQAKDNYIFTANSDGGLRITDVSNPFNPYEANFIDTIGYVYDLKIHNNLLFVGIANAGGHFPGLMILDISNSISPQFKSFIFLPGGAMGIDIKDTIVFVGTGGGMMSINISDLSNPLEMDFLTLDPNVTDIKILGNIAYAVSLYGGIKIINIERPDSLNIINSITNTSYPIIQIFIYNNYLISAATEVEIFDLHNPWLPVKIGSYFPPQRAGGIYADDVYAYVASIGRGLRIVNIQNPNNPIEVGYYSSFDGEAVYVRESIAYLTAGNEGLYLIGIMPKLNSPNGGEFWDMGNNKHITWQCSGIDSLTILFSRNGGINWEPLIQNIPAKSFLYSWLIPNTPSNECKVKMYNSRNPFFSDSSDENFIIRPVSLLSLNNGDTLEIGSLFRIEWIAVGVDTVEFDLVINFGEPNETWIINIGGPVNSNIGYYDWVVPNYISSKCLLRIRDWTNFTIADTCDTLFSIVTTTNMSDYQKLFQFELNQNYPNPFNPTTQINYSLVNNKFVTLKVYNSIGELVKSLVNEEKPAGNHSVTFDATGLPSGIYFYRITAGDFVETQKMVLLR